MRKRWSQDVVGRVFHLYRSVVERTETPDFWADRASLGDQPAPQLVCGECSPNLRRRAKLKTFCTSSDCPVSSLKPTSESDAMQTLVASFSAPHGNMNIFERLSYENRFILSAPKCTAFRNVDSARKWTGPFRQRSNRLTDFP